MGKSNKKKEEKKSKKKSAKREVKKHSKKEKKSHRKEENKNKSDSHRKSIESTDLKSSPPILNEISNDDYFNKNEEFRVWIKLYKNITFESLSSDEARKYFNDFVKYYNKGRLPDMYYTGIPIDVKNGTCIYSI